MKINNYISSAQLPERYQNNGSQIQAIGSEWLFLSYKDKRHFCTFHKCPDGTMLFPLIIYICYHILANDLHCIEYHYLIDPCTTSNNAIPPTPRFRCMYHNHCMNLYPSAT